MAIRTPAAGSKIAVLINATFVTIPNVEGIPEFGPMKGQYENTAINDTAKSFNTDLPDPGNIPLVGSWDSKDPAHAYLLAAAANEGAAESLKVTFHSTAMATFSAHVLSFRTSGAKGADEKFSCDLKVSGPVTYTAAT